ncbi:hypothetical protein M422DRAFT_272011 [Sphaerobolus stellatus SS14]|uniref:HAT C-terminal dimerisation domain-containing protein n=1 Tax=Sphaerobolus stellatus (strain SS14) TaxID=990650 RepID=A0A0C9TYF8_SPHS4|nr:hypothetical protein M422DRAFT_272011 [Sphaerobolus stellatus SS14]
MSRRDAAGTLTEILKMLILDVQTRWYSAHQMCILDPRINYKGLVNDHSEEPDLLEQIEKCKSALETHYVLYYSGRIAVRKRLQLKQTSSSASLSGSGLPPSPEKFNFTPRYAKQPANDRNELEEHFRQVPELWDGCDPVKWWGARQAQFPNLCRLAQDVTEIPGFDTKWSGWTGILSSVRVRIVDGDGMANDVNHAARACPTFRRRHNHYRAFRTLSFVFVGNEAGCWERSWVLGTKLGVGNKAGRCYFEEEVNISAFLYEFETYCSLSEIKAHKKMGANLRESLCMSLNGKSNEEEGGHLGDARIQVE